MKVVTREVSDEISNRQKSQSEPSFHEVFQTFEWFIYELNHIVYYPHAKLNEIPKADLGAINIDPSSGMTLIPFTATTSQALKISTIDCVNFLTADIDKSVDLATFFTSHLACETKAKEINKFSAIVMTRKTFALKTEFQTSQVSTTPFTQIGLCGCSSIFSFLNRLKIRFVYDLVKNRQRLLPSFRL